MSRSTALPVFLLPFAMLLAGCSSMWTAPPPTIAPLVITADPASLTVPIGETASFSVTATGQGTLTYQWSENGTAISGATSSSYTTPTTRSSDSGELFTVVVHDATTSATSTQAKLTIGGRSPKSGDLRFQQVGAPSASLDGAGAGRGSNILITSLGHTSATYAQVAGTPLDLGPSYWNCAGVLNCAWSYGVTALPSAEPNLAIFYTCDVYEYLDPDLAALPAGSSVVTSMDVPPGSDAYAIAVTSNAGSAGFDMLQEIVPPTAIQATVAADGLKSRVVTAITFDGAGQAHILSYGWTGDTSTVYDVTSTVVAATDVGTTGTSLAAEGYILSAFGGNEVDGYVIVGTKVQGDTQPRSLIVWSPDAPITSATALNGYAPVASVHYSDAQNPQSASDFSYLYEQ